MRTAPLCGYGAGVPVHLNDLSHFGKSWLLLPLGYMDTDLCLRKKLY